MICLGTGWNGCGGVERSLVHPLLDEAHELTAIFIAARKTSKDRTAEFQKVDELPGNNQ